MFEVHDSEPLESVVQVLGWSDGANAACLLAAAHPDRVAHLVIWGGNSYITAEDLRKYSATKPRSAEATERSRLVYFTLAISGVREPPLSAPRALNDGSESTVKC